MRHEQRNMNIAIKVCAYTLEHKLCPLIPAGIILYARQKHVCIHTTHTTSISPFMVPSNNSSGKFRHIMFNKYTEIQNCVCSYP